MPSPKRKPSNSYTGGLRSTALLAGPRDVARVDAALLSTATPRTIISRKLAKQIGMETAGPKVCVEAPWAFGKFCGRVGKVDVALPRCRSEFALAVVSDLPSGVDLAVGNDVLCRAGAQIDFGENGPRVSCPKGSGRGR